MNISQKLKQWEDARVVELMVEAIKPTKPVVYVVGSGVAGRISTVLHDKTQVIILDKLPEQPRHIDELLDYGPVFEAHVEIKKARNGFALLNEMSNNQPRNREHGWYRQFDKNSKKRNIK